jgi:quercetin dioxygenase-like cupin family protein
MTEGSFDQITPEEPYPGVVRRVFDGKGATVTRYDFAPGAQFPLHRHPQEQITLIQQGEVEFTVDGTPLKQSAGDFSIVDPDVEHGLKAGPNGASILAIVTPRRKDANAYTVSEAAA